MIQVIVGSVPKAANVKEVAVVWPGLLIRHRCECVRGFENEFARRGLESERANVL